MSTYSEILCLIREAETLQQKAQLLTYLANSLSDPRSPRGKASPADRREVALAAIEEAVKLPSILEGAVCYREKSKAFDILSPLMQLVMQGFGNPDDIPTDQREMLKSVVERCDKERFVENAVNECFREGNNRPTAADMERILCMVAPLQDEFHKEMLWQGLVLYRNQVERLPEDAKAVLARYAISEMERYTLACTKGEGSEDMYENLEFISDIVRSLMGDPSMDQSITAHLMVLFMLERPAVSYYALSTLLAAGETVPDEVILPLAKDVEYADRVYHLLGRYGAEERLPMELRDPIYLAKSDLVQWLAYPTELGKRPDEIEFLGQTKKKGEIYHIFRFKSDSENLDEESQNVWLVGWAGSEGGTFSHFDLYKDYDKGTVEKTVKYIRKKIL